MATIAENLQTLVDQKAALKAALESKGKEPTDALSTYPGLINELDNEEQVSYVLSNADGSQKIYAQLSGKAPVKLTATANDIRVNTSAITNEGYTDGSKNIPSYHSVYSKKILLAGKAAIIDIPEYEYKSLMITISLYDSSVTKSVAVMYASVDNALYEATTGEKISDITIDTSNEQINLGITISEKSVMRYFLVREEV